MNECGMTTKEYIFKLRFTASRLNEVVGLLLEYEYSHDDYDLYLADEILANLISYLNN